MPSEPKVLTKKEDMFRWFIEKYKDEIKYVWAQYVAMGLIIFMVPVFIWGIFQLPFFYVLFFIPITVYITYAYSKHEKKVNNYDDIMMYLYYYWRLWPMSLAYYERHFIGKEAFQKIALVFKKKYITLKDLELASGQKKQVEQFMLALISAEVVNPTTDRNKFKVNIKSPEEVYYRMSKKISSKGNWDKRYGILLPLAEFFIILAAIIFYIISFFMRFRVA